METTRHNNSQIQPPSRSLSHACPIKRAKQSTFWLEEGPLLRNQVESNVCDPVILRTFDHFSQFIHLSRKSVFTSCIDKVLVITQKTLRSHPAAPNCPISHQRRPATNGRTMSCSHCRHVWITNWAAAWHAFRSCWLDRAVSWGQDWGIPRSGQDYAWLSNWANQRDNVPVRRSLCRYDASIQGRCYPRGRSNPGRY